MVTATGEVARSRIERGKITGCNDRGVVEDSGENGGSDISAIESGAAGVFEEMRPAKYCSEGEAGRNYDLCCGAIVCTDNHATGHADGAGGA